MKEMTREEFQTLANKNNWETFTQRQVYQFSQDILKSEDPQEKEWGAIDYASLNRVEIRNEDLSKSIVFYREQQVVWDKAEDGTIMKARSGVYADTPANRKKGIVGMKYGQEKKQKEDVSSKYNSKQTEESIQRASKNSKMSDEELDAAVDKIRGKKDKTVEDMSLLHEYRERLIRRENKERREAAKARKAAKEAAKAAKKSE